MSAVEIKEELKTVTLKPVKRTGWLPEGHDGEYKFTGTGTQYAGPELDLQTRQLKTGLTEAEERALEKAMNLTPGTLSRYNKDYWATFYIKIPKDGMILYLENPKDYIIYKILKNHSKIAGSAMAVADSPGVEFYMTAYDEESKLENNKARTERDAIKAFGKLSTEEMGDVLKLYAQRAGNPVGRPAKNSSKDFIESALYKKVKANPEEFLMIVQDPTFKTRVLIDDLITNKILQKSGSKYLVFGGDVIGHTLEQTIDFLDNPHNQGVLIELKKKLEVLK